MAEMRKIVDERDARACLASVALCAPLFFFESTRGVSLR